MNKNKNKLMLFLCSCFPGAGHMYMGLMKQGISIMMMFCALLFITTALRLGPFVYLLPILWFYSFFDCWNKRNMKDEEFYGLRDDFLIPFMDGNMPKINMNKARPFIAIICILIGVERLLYSFGGYFDEILPGSLQRAFRFFWYNYTELLFSLLLIFIGIRMIKRKKKDMADGSKEDYIDVGFKEDEE